MPDALNLPRLARASPGQPVDLPGPGSGSPGLSVLHLTARQHGGERACTHVCLEGTLILDLPHGDFVQLRAGESYSAPAGQGRTWLPVGPATVLLVWGDV
ncbi:MAG: hypothetical protein ACR2J4_02835 [Deinococcus sp.]